MPSPPLGSNNAPKASRPSRRSPTQQPAAEAEERARSALTPETWIDAATEVLVDRGIDHVRVDVLAKQLQVTRGSFYWHFRDREDLLRRVLQAWRERATEALTQRLVKGGGDPRARLRDVISLPHRGRAAARAARIELAIRAWARRDEMARAAVDEADAQRLRYHREILQGLGFPAEEAAQRAFIAYGMEVAQSLLQRQDDAAQRQARQGFLERLLLSPLASGAHFSPNTQTPSQGPSGDCDLSNSQRST